MPLTSGCRAKMSGQKASRRFLSNLLRGTLYNAHYNCKGDLEQRDRTWDTLAGYRSMTHTTIKLRAVGTSTGTIFPREVLEHLQVGKGDTLHLIRTERGYELTPFDPDFEEAMAIYHEVAREYRDALRELAR